MITIKYNHVYDLQDYDDFDVANEDDELEEFLGIPRKTPKVVPGNPDEEKKEGDSEVNIFIIYTFICFTNTLINFYLLVQCTQVGKIHKYCASTIYFQVSNCLLLHYLDK